MSDTLVDRPSIDTEQIPPSKEVSSSGETEPPQSKFGKLRDTVSAKVASVRGVLRNLRSSSVDLSAEEHNFDMLATEQEELDTKTDEFFDKPPLRRI